MLGRKHFGKRPMEPVRRISAGTRVWPVLGLTLLGAVFRLLSLNTRSFWLDETTAVRQAAWSIPYMLSQMSNNVHPPLFHTLLHFWIAQFGRSELAVRGFAVTWGILAIPLAYWAASTIYDHRTGLFSAGIVAFSPFFIWYSQEARMYTMMLVFALVSMGALFRAMERNRVGWWVVYALAISAGTMTQYFFVFLIAGQALYFLIFLVILEHRRLAEENAATARWTRPWRIFADIPQLWGALASLVAVAIPLAWWVPQVLRHRELFRGVTQPFNYGWPPPTFGAHFNEQILVPVEWLFGFHSTLVMRDLVAFWPLLITAAFVLGGISRRIDSRSWYVVISGVAGASAIAALGFWQPILEARYFTAVGVPFVFMAARLLAGFRVRTVRVLVAVALTIAAVSWVDQSYNPDSIVKWDNRGAMGIVADGFKPGDRILLLPYFVTSIPEYYLPPEAYAALSRVPSFNRYGNLRNSPTQLGQDLARQVGGAKRVWVIATWQETPRIALDRKNTGDWLTANGYHVAQDHQLRQIRVTLYEGNPQVDFFLPPGGAR